MKSLVDHLSLDHAQEPIVGYWQLTIGVAIGQQSDVMSL